MRFLSFAIAALLVSACQPETSVGGPSAPQTSAPDAAHLRIATWNMEHLAEKNASGCRPREDADYAKLRSYASALDADVIAFQEVESLAAARRVFDPAQYDIIMETRTGTPDSTPPCNDKPGLFLNRQAVGFAIRKGLSVEHHPDLTVLQVGDPNLRSAVDITLKDPAGSPIRLLAVHLKSGCAADLDRPACPVLQKQARMLEGWIDQRAKEDTRFAILGDFNRRLALPGDAIWSELDRPPGATDLAIAAGDTRPRCDPKYTSFIDQIVIDPRIAGDRFSFAELPYAGERLSDHCAISIDVKR